MKQVVLLFLLFTPFISVKAKTWMVTSPGFVFSPATLTIDAGDTVIFELAGIHDVLEVSQSNWNANQANPLSGGFSLGFGGGTLLPADLSAGTHYYVCEPHASMGMKGIINVTPAASTGDILRNISFDVAPNPATNEFIINAAGEVSLNKSIITILDANGRELRSVEANVNAAGTIEHKFDVADLPRGLYLVRLRDPDGSISKQVILQ